MTQYSSISSLKNIEQINKETETKIYNFLLVNNNIKASKDQFSCLINKLNLYIRENDSEKIELINNLCICFFKISLFDLNTIKNKLLLNKYDETLFEKIKELEIVIEEQKENYWRLHKSLVKQNSY